MTASISIVISSSLMVNGDLCAIFYNGDNYLIIEDFFLKDKVSGVPIFLCASSSSLKYSCYNIDFVSILFLGSSSNIYYNKFKVFLFILGLPFNISKLN